MEADMELGEIPSLLDQRIRTFKHIDPTLPLTSKSPNDGQYGSFITVSDSTHVSDVHSQNYTARREQTLSPTTATSSNPHPSENTTYALRPTHPRSHKLSKPHQNNARLLPKYIAPPPIDIIRITQEDGHLSTSPLSETFGSMAKVDLPLPLLQSPILPQMSIQSIVTEMTHPLIPLLSPFPLEVLGKDSLDDFTVRLGKFNDTEEMSASGASQSKKRKKSDSSALAPEVLMTNDAVASISTTPADDIKKDVAQNVLVVSGGGTKITLKIPRKKDSAPVIEALKSPVPTENKLPVVASLVDLKDVARSTKNVDVDMEQEHRKNDKDIEQVEAGKKIDGRIRAKDLEGIKPETNHKSAQEKTVSPSEKSYVSKEKPKDQQKSKELDAPKDKDKEKEKGMSKESTGGGPKAQGEGKEKERARRITWTRLRTDATNLKRVADDLAKDDSTRAESLDMYLNATIKFLECCKAREQEDYKGAPDLYKQCALFFTTCAAICEKYKDNVRASIQLKSAALASSRSFQLKRDKMSQQCDNLIQQLRQTISHSSSFTASQTSANVPTPPAMPSPNNTSTPPSPGNSDKPTFDQAKLISILEDTKEACSVFETWTRSELLAQLEPLPNYAIVDINQAIEYIKRQVQNLALAS